MHEPEGRLSDVVPDASQIMAGTGLQGEETTAGSWFGIVDGSVPRVRYVCMFGVLCSGRTSGGAHAGACPSRAKLGERGPREQPKAI